MVKFQLTMCKVHTVTKVTLATSDLQGVCLLAHCFIHIFLSLRSSFNRIGVHIKKAFTH